MIKAISEFTTVVVVLLILISCAASPTIPGRISEDGLVGRMATAKIDLPLRMGMVVYSDGAIDFAVYRTKLESLGTSIHRYENAQITEVEIEDDQINVRLNQGGKGGLVHKGHLKFILPEQMNRQGTTIYIKYGRQVTGQDFRPEKLAYALRDVLEIQGLGISSVSQPQQETMVTSNQASRATLLSVEVQPSRTVSGQEVDLSVHFEVEGATTQNPLSLTIGRQLYKGDQPLFSATRTQQGYWAAGVHSAHFSLRVPNSTAPGVYRFKAWLSYAGKEYAREALFEVLEIGR